MLEIILADLRRIFGDKVLLTPEDIAEIIGMSVGQQANKRSDGEFPIPYDGSTGRIKISIYALAEYLANHGRKQVKTALKQEIKLGSDKPTRVQKKARKGHLEGQWWALRQRQVIAVINRSLFELELAVSPNEKKKERTTFKP
jgi:hypothetical protein